MRLTVEFYAEKKQQEAISNLGPKLHFDELWPQTAIWRAKRRLTFLLSFHGFHRGGLHFQPAVERAKGRGAAFAAHSEPDLFISSFSPAAADGRSFDILKVFQLFKPTMRLRMGLFGNSGS